MESKQTVRIVKKYDRPDFNSKPNIEDETRADKTELSFLRAKLAEHKDQIRRLKEEIADEIKMLSAALYDDQQESMGQIERRISRLKGALEYRGRASFIDRER
jgi:hypothetical protein